MKLENMLGSLKRGAVSLGLGLALLTPAYVSGCGDDGDETCDLTSAVDRYNAAYLEKQNCYNANELTNWDCEKESSCGAVDSLNLCAEEYENMDCEEYGASDYLSDNCGQAMLFFANHCKIQISLVYCPPHYRERGFCD